MYRLALKLCERSLHRVLTSNRLQCSTLSHVKKEKDVERQTMDLTSKRFPGYKLIYTFPYIAHAAAFNGGKRRFTYLTGAIVPVTIGLKLMEVIPYNTAVASITSLLILSIWLHSITMLCNNLVGMIYINQEEETVLLSYIDYWGQRLDLKTNINDVVPLSDNRLFITDSFHRTILLYSQKKKLKINLKRGEIIDVENFRYLLGMI